MKTTLPIESDGDDWIVTFTDELLEELGWNAGDELEWEVQEDGTITISKHEETTPDRLECTPSQEPFGFASYGSPIHDC